MGREGEAMRVRGQWPALLGACALAVALASPAPAQEVGVSILLPVPEPTFGTVLFEVEVTGEVLKVELLVDGKVVKTLKAPPWRAEVDVGEENQARRFEAVAHGIAGEIVRDITETPRFSVDDEISTELQQLYATVTRRDQRVLELTQDDFEILDNGRKQELVTFGRGEIPLASAVLIDSSTSMVGERLRSALRGAETFLRAMRPGDETSLTLFSDRWLHVTPFSGDAAGLIGGLHGVRANGGTSLNDTLYLALKKLENQQGRRVVILLSDGVDTHSALRMAEVSWLSQRSRALIYWIRTDPDASLDLALSSSWKSPEVYREERKQLLAMVEESGGRVVQLADLSQAQSAFNEILAELREQYVLGYYPTDNLNDGAWHRIQVKLRQDGLQVRTKNGYLDY
jgi:Ca-activated chloride channel family protein